jgi:hypothetical protein
MLAFCLLVWTHICVTPEYKHATKVGGQIVTATDPLFRGTTHRLGATIDVYAEDSFYLFGTTGNSRTCRKEICVSYRKHCTDRHTTCDYKGGIARADARFTYNDFWVTITARSRKSLNKAEAAVFLNLGQEGRPNYISLSLLDEETTTLELFHCKGNARTEGCLTREDMRKLRRHLPGDWQ